MSSIILAAILSFNTAHADVHVHVHARNQQRVHHNRYARPHPVLNHRWVWVPGHWKRVGNKSQWVQGQWNIRPARHHRHRNSCHIHR